MLAILAGVGALSWYLDKTHSDSSFTDKRGNDVKVKDPMRPKELGYQRELATKIPWGANRATHIGDLDYKVPLPYVNIMPGGENAIASTFKQAVLPMQKENFKKLVHQRENLEEYWRFDNYLGGKYPVNNSGIHRQSSIAYTYQ
jgi:hypothetical protein